MIAYKKDAHTYSDDRRFKIADFLIRNYEMCKILKGYRDGRRKIKEQSWCKW